MHDIEVITVKERLLLLKGYLEGVLTSGCGCGCVYDHDEFKKVIEPIEYHIGKVLNQLKEVR
jgi:hypothetical protein